MKNKRIKNFCLLLILILLFSCEEANAKQNRYNVPLVQEQSNTQIFKNSIHSVVNISPTNILRGVYFSHKEIPRGVGTGIVWNKDGYIITNAHVINGAYRVFVSFYQDEKKYEAKLIGVEPQQDIAVLKVINKPNRSLIPIKKGDSSQIQVGEKALAIGSPFNLDYTMTSGIISATGRKIRTGRGMNIYDMIQTDASINPGNSGGPLLNSRGEVIGINTGIYSAAGGNNGINFAIPLDTVKRVVGDIIKHGKVIRPIIGISTENYLGKGGGVHISRVFPNSPAEKAGLRGSSFDNQFIYSGDIIIAVDDKNVKNYSDLYYLFSQYNVGDKVKITILRRGKKKEVSLNLGSNE